MEHNGILFLSKTRPQVSKAADGTFQLTLHALDRLNPHQVEAWTLLVSGQMAAEFWAAHQHQLTAGQPIRIWSEHVRAMANPLPYIYAKCSSIWLAPRAQQAAQLLAEMDAK
jgi:hypothetical protein